jgi:hypothetical protein
MRSGFLRPQGQCLSFFVHHMPSSKPGTDTVRFACKTRN